MHRFFINSDLRKGLEIYLKNPTSHQIKNVSMILVIMSLL